MDFPVGLGHMAGYLKGPQFPGHGPPALAGPFGLGHTLDHSPYGGKFKKIVYIIPLYVFLTLIINYDDLNF